MTVDDRVVVIAGASSGVGRATARAFAKRGASVALLARGSEGLEQATREVDQLGGRGLTLSVDVSDAAEVDQALASAESTFGPVDVWVNNAMVSIVSPVSELEPAELRRVTEVTYLGTAHGTMAALRSMRARDHGVIIQVGSALAYRGIPLQAPYCAAKHAIQGFTESLRSELLHEGSSVRVTMVQLPALNTPQFQAVKTRLPRAPRPVAPVFQPEVAAKAILWASEHPRRELFVGWPTIRTIFGNRIAPGVGDRLLARIGYEAQQTSEAVEPQRPDNLWTPLQRDLGVHGQFDCEARAHSIQLALSTHRARIAAFAGVAAAALAAWRYGRSNAVPE